MLKRKIFVIIAAVVFAVALGGCTTANFSPVYSVGDVETYKVMQETTKEVGFEQPSLNKSKLDTTQSTVEMVFDQEPVEVADNGDAVFNIHIKAIKLYSKGQKGVNIDYDSSREADKTHEISKLLGKSYKIKITADGKASLVDASEASSVSSAREVKALVSSEAIENRHSIMATPQEGEAVIAKNKSWVNLGSTPKGALQPKAFEKTFTLSEIKDAPEGKIAVIDMSAIETNKKVEGFDSTGGLGVMANIFDSTSDYSGKLEYNITTGKIVSYSENLVSEHIAAEEPRGGDASKGPDVLTMRFISAYSIEEVK